MVILSDDTDQNICLWEAVRVLFLECGICVVFDLLETLPPCHFDAHSAQGETEPVRRM
jgi:hypothetical protein